jgi:hypothetical protein
MRASTLQRKIDKDGIASDRGLTYFTGHWTSQKIAVAPTTKKAIAVFDFRSTLRISKRRGRAAPSPSGSTRICSDQ